MNPTFDSIQTRESQYVLHTYRRQPVAFVKGKGPRLYDVDGREYLDFVSGIGVASLVVSTFNGEAALGEVFVG